MINKYRVEISFKNSKTSFECKSIPALNKAEAIAKARIFAKQNGFDGTFKSAKACEVKNGK